MLAQDNGKGQDAITAIQRHILVNWAMLPPMYNVLHRIDFLIATVHTVLPGHDYFSTWRPVRREELMSGEHNYPDEGKLQKAIRKVRFLLHPYKLPRDFDEQQNFWCKLLWDILSDALDGFKEDKENRN